jgi:monoamine oxidase
MGIRYPDRELAPDPGIDRGALERAAAAVEAAAQAAPDEHALALLARTVADPAIRELLAARTQSARAYPIERLRATFLTDVSHLIETAETRRVRGGNDLIARRLAEGLGSAVHRATPVHRVAQHATGVRVDDLDADACVLAVPLPVLARLELLPGLPDGLADWIAATPTGVAAKLAVPLREPVAARAVMSVAHRFWAYTTPCDEVGGRVLGSWAGSASVVEALESDSGAERWLDRIDELWPGLPLDREAASIALWRDGEWDGGAYSVQPRHPVERAGPGPGRFTAGRIVLAGEHTAGEWAATIEGALRSGLRAAADVEALLRPG